MQLPPLAAARAFEAAARHESFTKAAEELGMTQAAVSYQIKLLEERVGTPLFLRKPRQVKLTEAGRRMAPRLTEAFALIAEAYADSRGDAQETLNLSTLFTFASNWLAQNLGSFQIGHPSIAVRVDTANRIADFARDEVDVAIRSGKGVWPGTEVHRLFSAGFTPMLTPQLAASIGGVIEPADLLKLPILDARDPWWAQWFSEAGVADPGLTARPELRLGTQAYEATSAMAGNGVAILTRAFFRTELAEGRLIQPFELVCDDGNAFWLAYAKSRRNVPKIKAFREWLLPTIERTI